VGLEKGATDNLMDYGTGYGLIKYQWDVLHDPGSVWGVFEDDDAGDNYVGQKISRDFINKDNKTVSFLTPAATVLAIPFEKLGKVQFQYGAVYVDEDKLKFGADLTVGSIRSFELSNSEGTMERYSYDDDDGTYNNDVTHQPFTHDADQSMVDGFVYPIQCDGKLTLYKFSRAKLPLYNKSGEAKLKFIEFADAFKPFSVNIIVTNAIGGIISQTIPAEISEKCLHCISKATVSMIKDHCNQPEYLWIDKIAQMRHIYPEYFESFTQPEDVVFKSIYGDEHREGNWEQPKEKVSAPSNIPGKYRFEDNVVYGKDYVWGKYLIDNPVINAAYESDKVLFYRTFYVQFVEYLKKIVGTDANFWANLTEATDGYKVFEQVEIEPLFHLQTIPVEQRGLGLKLMTRDFDKYYKVNDRFGSLAYIRLLSSFKGEDQLALLKYIEENITIKSIYELFDEMQKAESSQIGVLMALSNMVTATGYSNNRIDEKHKELDAEKVDALLEADLLQFKNVSIEFKEGNTLKINEKDYRYNDIVSVEIAGSFKMGKYTFDKGSIVEIPAIQVALMRSITGSQVTEKVAWLTFDVGTMLLGIGSAKVLFSVGNYIQKAIVYADLIGSTAGIGLQLLDEDAISPELRTGLQIASFVSSVPSMLSSIPRIERVIKKIDTELNGVRLAELMEADPEKAKKVIQKLKEAQEELRKAKAAQVSEFSDDADEITRRVVTLDDDKEIADVSSWLHANKAQGDKNVYLVVHGDNGRFSVIVDGQDVVMDHNSLVDFINSKVTLPADGQLVLLSCVDIETGQHLARRLERPIVANDGAVRVYNNGVIEADNGFRYIGKDGNIDDSKSLLVGKQGKPSESFVALGKAKAIANVSVADIASRYRIGNELAERLAKIKEFTDAYKANSKFLEALEKALPDVSLTMKGKRYANYRDAVLTLFADDPSLFASVNALMKEADDIVKACNRTKKFTDEDFSLLAAIRYRLLMVMKEAPKELDRQFFLYGVFNSVVTDHAALDALGWAKIDKARRDSKIDVSKNILVSEIHMKGKTTPDVLVANSGSNAKTVNVVPEIENNVGSFGQFVVGHNRLDDSESKLFEYLWEILKSKKELKARDIEKIVLYSERPVCPSCLKVIYNFRKKTGIEIVVYEGKYLR